MYGAPGDQPDGDGADRAAGPSAGLAAARAQLAEAPGAGEGRHAALRPRQTQVLLQPAGLLPTAALHRE